MPTNSEYVARCIEELAYLHFLEKNREFEPEILMRYITLWMDYGIRYGVEPEHIAILADKQFRAFAYAPLN